MTILDKIKENAQKYPDREMMIEKMEGGMNVLTWKELDDYSDYLSSWLDETLYDKKPVVVYGHKSPWMIVSFLACVKSGRAYCPVDVNVPLARVQAIIDEVKPDLVLATENLSLDIKNIVALNAIEGIIEHTDKRIDRAAYVEKEDIFYIIFTSGSTGYPKGVQITRDCLDNFINWAITLGNGIDDNKHYVFLNQAPFSFDLSVMDLFLCLYSGGTLWALPKSVQSNMKFLCDSLRESDVNVWVSTPSFADICLSEPIFSETLLPNLTDFLFCGEILTNKTVDRLTKRFPNSKIINTYGPTESTCAITEIEVTPELNEQCVPLPVGKPKAGTWIHIVDNNNEDVPDGERGEIVIVGDSVSAGYWNNSEQTEKVFGICNQDGKQYRSYHTGDEGYLLNGMLYYGGRIDLQVKLHGYRIELEDIENNLLKIKGIVQAVVVPKYRDGKVSSLAAGIVTSETIIDELTAIKDIREKLKKSIPEYMIPKKIRFVDSIPRTNNGKVDRKKLGGLL